MIFCVLDTETTGLQEGHHEIIQLAAILCDGQLEETARVSFKIKPRYIERASPKALEVNGYNPLTWKPDFYSHTKALNYFNKFIESNNVYNKNIIMVGQNVQFDYKFMQKEYDRYNIFFPFSGESLDLIMVAKIWSSITGNKLQRHSLAYLAQFTGQVNTNPHDAEADAEVTLDILKWFVKDLKKVSKNDKRRFRKYSSLKI